MESIEDYLKNLDRLAPIKTGVDSKFEKNSKIKAVLFDIYGTLIISASGDIDKADIKSNYLKQAMLKGGFDVEDKNDEFFDIVLNHFKQAIRESHLNSKDKGILHPEIEVIQVWKSVFAKEEIRSAVSGASDIGKMAFIFELLSNKVFPMPNMLDTLRELQKRNIPLGIVSNAQFYTPIMMNYFIDGVFKEEEFINGFRKDLSVYSFKELKAKPDYSIFKKLIPVLKDKYNIQPEEAVFVGNDMLNDIYAANKAGFKTILFAGDKRSLRLRRDKDETKNLNPDYIITDLSQLLEIVNN